MCVCERKGKRKNQEIPAETPGAAEPQGSLFKPQVGERSRGSGETPGKVARGRCLRCSFKKAGGLSPAAQWNHGIASAGSERKAGSPPGGRGFVCVFTQSYHLQLTFFFSTASLSSFLCYNINQNQNLLYCVHIQGI